MSHHDSLAHNVLLLIGRIFFALIFVVAGFGKLAAFKATATMMATKGVPYAELMLVIAIILELGGGLLVLLGWYTRLGGLLLLIFIIPVTLSFHAYWTMEGAAMINNFQHFFKNLALLGGSLYIMAVGAGSMSIDGMLEQKKDRDS